MKALRKIAILLAGAFLMLHTFLPHEHHSEQELEHIAEHKSADSFMDYIKLAFHLDQGEGHLESFETAKSLQLSFPMVAGEIQSFTFKACFYFSEKVEFTCLSDCIPEHHFISSIQFRGPPIIG